jgi:YegS/Rv2252/BmrU family lipid kinase
MPNNFYLIFNPISGQGDAATELAQIQGLIEPHARLTVLQTTPEVGASELAKQAIASGADCVIASGGDGTVSVVAGELASKNIPLGIIPRGTANAIAVAFAIPTDIRGACELLVAGTTNTIDIALLRNQQSGQQPLLLLAGIGLEAEIIAQANRQLKNRLGSAAYILSAFRQVQNIENFTAELETPDKIITVEAVGITVANAAPATSVLAQGPSELVPHDGLLDVTIFAPQGTGSAIAATYDLFQSAVNQRASQREDIGYFRCTNVTIHANPPQKVVLDGEMIGTTPVQITCLPQSLQIIAPKANLSDPHEKLEDLPNVTVQHKS